MNAPAGLLALALSAFLGAACCPAAQAQVRVNPHDEAARLIRALDLSTAQRNAALDFMIVEMARGGSAPLPRGHVFRLPGVDRDKRALTGLQQVMGWSIRLFPGS
jgi:hypothetical protein